MNPEVKNWSEQSKHETEVAEYNLSGVPLGDAAPYSENLVNAELNTTRKAPFGCKLVVALAKHWVVPIG